MGGVGGEFGLHGLLRTTMVRAADTARRQDPQLARIYYQQMTERGKDYLGTLCVTAAHLAERAWTVMRRGTPYVICDTDGQPVTAEAAKAIIAGRWTVPPEIRARRRGKKTGKAPQKVLAGQYARGDLPRSTAPPPRERLVKQALDNRSSIGNQNRRLRGWAGAGSGFPAASTCRNFGHSLRHVTPFSQAMKSKAR